MTTVNNTKQHILLAAIEAIEKHGLSNLTTRLIAEEAGVNNAALHYYYGTKEQLVDAALNQTARHMLDDTREILEAEEPIEDRMRKVFTYLLEGVYKFPNIIRAHMIGPLFYEERQGDLLNLFSTWVSLIAEALAAQLDSSKLASAKLHLNMIFSQILMVGMSKTQRSGRLSSKKP
jgi:AcrR family transcriptional regulator